MPHLFRRTAILTLLFAGLALLVGRLGRRRVDVAARRDLLLAALLGRRRIAQPALERDHRLWSLLGGGGRLGRRRGGALL